MNDLLKFIDNFILDDQLYYRIPKLHSKDEFEVHWIRKENPSWHLRKVDTISWENASSENLIELLNKNNLDISILDANLRSSIIQQVIFADMVIEKATELLGTEAINQSREDNKNFMSSLVEVIKSLVSLSAELPPSEVPPPKPSLRIVRE